MRRWRIRRERDRYTRAISLVVTRGWGLHVGVTLWWFTVSYHRRDAEMERLIREALAPVEGLS